MGYVARPQVSVRTVRRRLQQHVLSARRLWLRLPLKSASQTGASSKWYRDEHTLAVCIRHRHTGPSPGVMVWGAIGYTCRSPLVRTDSILNSARYISSVLHSVSLPFIRALRNPTFQQNNKQLYISGIIRTFLDTKNVRLLPWSARSPDLSPIENTWSMVTELLARHHTPVTTVDELWHRIEATLESASVRAIQFLCDSMPRRISAVITARGVVLGTDFSGSMHPNVLKI
ncbi:transposable element Tc1 transposase [Trichonephila clavipes]|nr:transposable element Tc1 transposase [Trichonephila clavipes]